MPIKKPLLRDNIHPSRILSNDKLVLENNNVRYGIHTRVFKKSFKN